MGRSPEEPDLPEPGIQRPVQHTCQVPHSGIRLIYMSTSKSLEFVLEINEIPIHSFQYEPNSIDY